MRFGGELVKVDKSLQKHLLYRVQHRPNNPPKTTPIGYINAVTNTHSEAVLFPFGINC